jgi:hypothetical protein
MKKLVGILSLMIIFSSGLAHAKKPELAKKNLGDKVKANGAVKGKSRNLRNEMNFRDQLVNGKFQIPGDSAIEVENEKPVFNLLQIRSDFNDRRLKESTRDQ